jgi:hypothetical protein
MSVNLVDVSLTYGAGEGDISLSRIFLKIQSPKKGEYTYMKYLKNSLESILRNY